MNKRIQELYNQCFVELKNDVPNVGFDFEKFAELIIRECCEVLEQTQDALDRQKWPTPRGCTEYIKEHFGVNDEVVKS